MALLPDEDLTYIPNVVTPAEEFKYVREILSLGKQMKQVGQRKTLSLGGSIVNGVLIKTQFPGWLKPLLDIISNKVENFGNLSFNHILVNVYEDGQGIFDHQDGPCYYPKVAVLSLGTPAVMNFRAVLKDGGIAAKIERAAILEPRSLLIFKNNAYTKCTHGIDSASTEEIGQQVFNTNATAYTEGSQISKAGVRLSLTIRRVLNTNSVILRL